MLVSLTVGKVDAGVAVLLTEDKRLIEFPSILLPPDIHSGSIVDINVARNHHAETVAEQQFAALQSTIYSTFGSQSPSAPVLRCRNVTQTSIVLEWDPIQLATAELRSLSLYRNGTKAGVIPRDKLSTKISGLGLDTEYTFHLVLRTSAGQYSSERVTVKTHKMTDLSGITITPGAMPPPLKESLAETVQKIGAKMVESVRIDTTHFVCTEPRGQAWEKAVEMNVPVVVPDWVKGCEREGRVVGVRGYYLDADPKLRQMGPMGGVQGQGSQQRLSVSSAQQQGTPRIEHTPPTPERPRAQQREVEQAPPAAPSKAAAESEDEDEDEEEGAGYEAVGGSSGGAGAGAPGSSPATKKDDSDDDEAEEDDASDAESSAALDKGKVTSERRGPNDSEDHDETSEREAAKVAEEDGKFDEVAL